MVADDFPKPFITEEPRTKVVLKGENVTLTCRAESTASSPMTCLWKKDNLIFKGSQAITIGRSSDGRSNQMTSELLLHNISDEDSGRYQCVVSNDFGSTYSSRASIAVHGNEPASIFFISVRDGQCVFVFAVFLVFPTFTKTPTDIRVKAGNTARLECHAEGSPSPDISWKKDGGDDFPAARERRMHVMSNDDVFFIVNVKAADMGIYSCTAQNVAGVVVANATLTVLGKHYLQLSLALILCYQSGSDEIRNLLAYFCNLIPSLWNEISTLHQHSGKGGFSLRRREISGELANRVCFVLVQKRRRL